MGNIAQQKATRGNTRNKSSNMNKTKIKGFLQKCSVAVVTGGSSGIGENFISTIQECNPDIQIFNLSRSKPSKNLAEKKLVHIPCDLTESDKIGTILPKLEEEIRKGSPSGGILLINNSGFGLYGPFHEHERERQLAMIDLNIRAMVDLTARLLPLIRTRGGGILNVASTASFQPCPRLGIYGATKAFVLSWSLALRDELKPEHIRVHVLCPGPTPTNFFKAAGFDQRPLGTGKGPSAKEVAEAGLDGLARRRALTVPGFNNKVLSAFSTYAPVTLRLKTRIAAAVLKKVR